jgi:hypothetical protein
MKQFIPQVCQAARKKTDSFLMKVAAAYVIFVALVMVFNDSDG